MLLFSDRKKIESKYYKWIKENDIKDCSFNVISFLAAKNMINNLRDVKIGIDRAAGQDEIEITVLEEGKYIKTYNGEEARRIINKIEETDKRHIQKILKAKEVTNG